VALLRGAAVVACPSRFEGLPLVCVEALAAGRPVVASAVNGTPELIRDGDTGLLVPPNDSAALAAALRRVLAAPEEAARLAARGRELVERDNPWPVVTRRYLALCAEVAGQQRAPVAA
jgi:glycosyltransferase involved in cell wall biosynthesis